MVFIMNFAHHGGTKETKVAQSKHVRKPPGGDFTSQAYFGKAIPEFHFRQSKPRNDQLEQLIDTTYLAGYHRSVTLFHLLFTAFTAI